MRFQAAFIVFFNTDMQPGRVPVRIKENLSGEGFGKTSGEGNNFTRRIQKSGDSLSGDMGCPGGE